MYTQNNICQFFTYVLMDVTSRCNLRCKFCFNDFNYIAKHPMPDMSSEIFLKALEILPFVDNKFLLSCLYEPTLNANFFDLLDLLPQTFRHKIFFTTNIAKKLTEEQLCRLSKANVGHINISIETLDPDTYLRLTGRNSSFFENLPVLASVFAKIKTSPRLHFITMACRENYEEISSIVKTCYHQYGSSFHEIRSPFYAQNLNSEFLHESILSADELDKLRKSLSEQDIPHVLFDSTSKESIQSPQGNMAHDDIDIRMFTVPPQDPHYYMIRILSNGTIHFHGSGKHGSLLDINNFPLYLTKSLEELNAVEAEHYKIQEYDYAERSIIHSFDQICYAIGDLLLVNNRFIKIAGWAFIPDENSTDFDIELELSCGDKFFYFKTKNIDRPDVATVYNNTKYTSSGFEVVFDLPEILGYQFNVTVLFRNKLTNIVLFSKTIDEQFFVSR